MAFITQSFVTLATLLVLITLQSDHASAVTLVVNGGLHCIAPNPAASCTSCTPLAGVEVQLMLNRNPVASAVTNVAGQIIPPIQEVFPDAVTNARINLSQLSVRARTPIASCSVWANVAGTLQGRLDQQIVGTLVNGVITVTINNLHYVA